MTETADTGVESIRQGTVVLGVTSSIAAYKAADLTSKLVQDGVDVRVVMTENATRLVAPHTFLTLSRNPVITSLWNTPAWQPRHIALAETADLLLVAPATANIIAKLAAGIADDALSTFAVAHEKTIVVAPAMNPRMWRSKTVQRNCGTLRENGVIFVDPEPGRVACSGDGEPGRLASVERIRETVLRQLRSARAGVDDRHAKQMLVTAGPTREAIDPVRFVTNRSSGKMGYAIADALAAKGHRVTLVSGPTQLPTPPGCQRIDVTSAAQMAAEVKEHFPACDGLFMAAAVADYQPAEASAGKLKKTAGELTLTLRRTEDILKTVSGMKKPNQVVVGFAAETQDVRENAQTKLREKHLDWLVANDVSRNDIGFASEANQAVLLGADGSCEEWPRMPKTQLAAKLVERILA